MEQMRMEEKVIEKLPKVYKRNGKECYLDPIREKLIYITPEETVRQKVIIHLTENLQVPIAVVECKAPNIALDLNAKELLWHVLEYIIEWK